MGEQRDRGPASPDYSSPVAAQVGDEIASFLRVYTGEGWHKGHEAVVALAEHLVRVVEGRDWRDVADAGVLRAGSTLRYRADHAEVVVCHRKDDDSGWWLTSGGGLADGVIVRDWQVKVDSPSRSDRGEASP